MPATRNPKSRGRRRTRNIDSRQRRNPKNEVKRHINRIHDEDDDRFYVIEKLLDKRLDDEGNEEYLVRWLNYASEHDTWEPRSELEKNSRDMILEYNRMRQPDNEFDTLHCICNRPYRFEQGGMIQCYYCFTWYHFTCIGMNMEEANAYQKYICTNCTNFNPKNKSLIKETKLATFYPPW